MTGTLPSFKMEATIGDWRKQWIGREKRAKLAKA
jgi:hypothetical protein